MQKPSKYPDAKRKIEAGEIKRISELINAVNKTQFSKDIETSPARLKKLVIETGRFKFRDMNNIAKVVGVPDETIFDLVIAERWKDRAKKQ